MTTSPHTLEADLNNLIEELNVRLREHPKQFENNKKYTVSKLLTLFQKTIEEVIGEDEQAYTKFTPEKDFTTNLLNSQKMARNNLRSEQRKALEDIVEGKEKSI